MPVYGLQTFKSDGTTVVLQNSTPSAVFGQIFTLTSVGTGASRSEPISGGRFYYYKDFTEYVGRTIRPIQLRPGNQEWIIGTSNNVPYIRWNRNLFVPGDYDIYVPEFSYTDTVLYVFVK
jgi:hypothetical protein